MQTCDGQGLQGYTRPELTDDVRFEVEGGRHPVVDALQQQREFVRNDCNLTRQPHWLITGANMGGKSTFLRQNALLAVLAQMGSFVPATRAVVGLVDRVCTRIGAGDNLANNQSTFMLEMTEMAQILRLATPRSFVILDEVGRGTSPGDGLALCVGSTRHLHDVVGCRTLSATHLTALAPACASLAGVACHYFATHVDETAQPPTVAFSHRLMAGVAKSSYGLAIARLAGVPESVIAAAQAFQERDSHQTGNTHEPDVPAAVLSANEAEVLALFRRWQTCISPATLARLPLSDKLQRMQLFAQALGDETPVDGI
jgi:DNA mismatch repair protein MutS